MNMLVKDTYDYAIDSIKKITEEFKRTETNEILLKYSDLMNTFIVKLYISEEENKNVKKFEDLLMIIQLAFRIEFDYEFLDIEKTDKIIYLSKEIMDLYFQNYDVDYDLYLGKIKEIFKKQTIDWLFNPKTGDLKLDYLMDNPLTYAVSFVDCLIDYRYIRFRLEDVKKEIKRIQDEAERTTDEEKLAELKESFDKDTKLYRDATRAYNDMQELFGDDKMSFRQKTRVSHIRLKGRYNRVINKLLSF